MNRQRRRSAWVQTELGSERHQPLLADRLDQREEPTARGVALAQLAAPVHPAGERLDARGAS